MILKDLLHIRRAREARAIHAVTGLSAQRVQAQVSVDQAVVQLDSCRAYAHETELALYRDVCGHVVSLRDIEHVRGQVDKLRSGMMGLERSLDAAQRHLQDVSDDLGAARTHRNIANREKDKTTEFCRIHAFQDAMDSERKVEEDLDEAAAMIRGSATHERT